MTAKEYLNQAYDINCEIESKLTRIEYLQNLATRITPILSDMPHSSTPDNHTLAKTLDEIVDLKKELSIKVADLINKEKEIDEVISKVKDAKYRNLLEMRHLDFKSWKQIAVSNNYGIDNIYKLYKKALDCVEIPKSLQ